ncbi:hypothetical protein N7532_003377 [Penicillium argentinense]|uniref:Hepatocellular carcinoma-associated antigen 59-domain-containing protein n=1 Tax=Penicillium argentinense TaxID=1131581 RepID=A0A9W9FMD0_9EURO|nr:uncharacterized protein N7532_003377 [Penicillium argentinense]KAJ5102848.1 hypothetical protein N7532_003377 [Penicillium argentinense]
MDPEDDINPEALFRPVKRRKFMRRWTDRDDEDTSRERMPDNSEKNQRAQDPQSSQQEDDDSTEVSQVVRGRRPNLARKGGIRFTATSRSGKEDTGTQQNALTPAGDSEKEKGMAMCDRFTSNSGQAVDVDRHMMAYIDSEMAKRYGRNPPPENEEEKQSIIQKTSEGQSISGQPEREPASLGKLQEIDLGQETRLRNIARTEAATRRLVGDEILPASGEPQTDHPDTGDKSWRNHKRRTSADMERDRLVEEVLRESKLDVYDDFEDEPQPDDQAADDRIAEQFRRDFMDAIQSRRRQRTNTKPVNSKVEPPKGPKLGGSRSARAAMRDMQSKTGQK